MAGRLGGGGGERVMEWPNDNESFVVCGWSLLEKEEGLEKKSWRIVGPWKVWSEVVEECSWREERLMSFQTSSSMDFFFFWRRRNRILRVRSD